MPSRQSARRASLAAVACVLVAGPTTAAAVAPRVPTAADRLLDVRLAARDRAAATGAVNGLAGRSPRTADRVEAARDALSDDLGRQGVLDVDPLTGSVRQLARLDGALTGPTGAAPAATARSFARGHATALGLDAADVDGLRVAAEDRTDSGLTVVALHQSVDGIPAFDGDLRVAVDRAGRVLSVAGAPRSDLPARVDPRPPLSAADALARLMDQTGLRAPVTVTGTEQDARRTTRFSTGDVARLTLFGAGDVHLAWHLTYRATSTRWFDAVVDATTGEVLYRANLVKFATPASVYRNHPGAPLGGSPVGVDLAPFLTAGATTLTGPNVHAWADTNDDDLAQGSEEVVPGAYSGSFDNNRASGACDATHLCTWNHLTPSSWSTNKSQNVTQTFWYANRIHEHLATAPIGFNAASGAFQGDDPLRLNALDGAATGAGGGPDQAHLDNANMGVPADGQSPTMQMYLFASQPGLGLPFRDIDGGDDAAVLYHEYAHGLSSRLVTHGDGTQALNSPQAGAMGEGWSDWYAFDLLVRESLVADTAGTDGDLDVGRYTDAVRHQIRHQALDCAVGSSNAAACPASGGAGVGGFTFGDFGKIAGAPEVHADGEIWVQTLWQLRQRLVAKLGSDAAGSDAAERMITDAMRLSGPEPTFLDMRNAILAADLNAFGGADRDLIWEVFASRGMGFHAAVDGSTDTAPVEDFSAPPAPGTPRGAVAGTVTSANTGLPLGGVVASIGGLTTDPSFETYFAAGTDPAGRYAIADLPQGSYPKVAFHSAAGYDRAVGAAAVTGAATATLDVALRRDWAASGGQAKVASTNDDLGKPFGCGAAALIDQSLTAGWSAENHRNDAPATRYLPTITIELPQAIAISAFAMDPGSTCGDDRSAATKEYRVETSPDGASWTTAVEGAFGAGAGGRLNRVAPTAGASGVRFVRLTLKSPQSEAAGGSGADYIDFSELEVYGDPPNALPAGALAASPATPTAGEVVTLDARSFTDPDSAITAYDWDVDGNGTVDQTTTAPLTTAVYGALGPVAPTVSVHDYRGGAGTAATGVTVIAGASGTGRLPPPSAKPKARPSFVLPRTGTKGRVSFRATCKDPCRLGATLTVGKTVKQRYRLRSITVGRLTTRTVKGTRKLAISLTADARKRLRRRHVKKLRVALRVTATVTGGGPRRTAAKSVTLKL